MAPRLCHGELNRAAAQLLDAPAFSRTVAGVGDGAHQTTGGWVSARDRATLASIGIVDVRVSDRRAFPALECSFDGYDCLLALDAGGVSTLEIGGRPVATFRYESSVELMRYRLVGWDDATAVVPRRAVAYLTAMQRCAVAEDALAHPDLFPVRAPARDRTV